MFHSRGYTLVEILVAIAILAIVLLPILSAIGQAVRGTQESRNVTEALHLAEERMNTLWDLFGPQSEFYGGGVPFDFEGGSAGGGVFYPGSNPDPALEDRLNTIYGSSGQWAGGQFVDIAQPLNNDPDWREPAMAVSPSVYGCLASESADWLFNDNVHICIDPNDPNNLIAGLGRDLSGEKYRVAMAVLAARLDSLDAVAHYLPGLHPDGARWVPLASSGTPCSSVVDGDCPKIDGVEDFGEIVDNASLQERTQFSCAGKSAGVDGRVNYPWWDFGYVADNWDSRDSDWLQTSGYTFAGDGSAPNRSWRMFVVGGGTVHPNHTPQTTQDNQEECTFLGNIPATQIDIARALQPFSRFRRETSMATVYWPMDAHDPTQDPYGQGAISPDDARYYRSGSLTLGRAVRVVVAWRAGDGCPMTRGLVTTSRCGDPTNPLRISLGLTQRIIPLNKSVELRAFIPDVDQDPCDLEPHANDRTNRLSNGNWDLDPNFQHEECWHISGL